MSLSITPGSSVEFTVTKTPTRSADRKTLQRLMQMQPSVQKTLRNLRDRRRRKDNDPRRRAGLIWVHRAKATRVTSMEKGETFTLHVTPQMIPDLNSIESFISAG